MFKAFYTTLFGTNTPQQNQVAGVWMGGLSCIVLALNTAGQMHTSLLGLCGLIILFLLLGVVGCYWYLASIHLLSQWLMVPPEGTSVSSDTRVFTALQGLWPLILLGPAVSAQRWWPSFGIPLTFIILLSTGPTLIIALCRAYETSWPQAMVCLSFTLISGGLALVGLVGWPMMLILGARNF
jgi:hypothetical protein